MLSRLEIYGLYGLYNYKLDFSKEEDSWLKIITGPNGYGKTTILQFIYALFCKDFAVFMRIPFTRVVFIIDDDILQINQTRATAQVDPESDLPGEQTVKISFEQIDDMTGKVILLQEFEEGNKEDDINGQLRLLLGSMKCFFLTDERVLLRKTETENKEHNANEDSSMERIAKNVAAIKKNNDKDQRIALLEELVYYFKFADKDMIVDGTFGIRFRIRNSSKTLIPITSLSSGERHVLLQLYELIFDGKSGDLVMIDEPELSFHPAWLNVYVSVLSKIQAFKREEGRNMQIILATHSSMLIGGRWDETLDLYTLRNNG